MIYLSFPAVTYYDNLSSSDTLSGRSSEGSISLSSALAKYCRFENLGDVTDSEHENTKENLGDVTDSEYENTKENLGDVTNSEYENTRDFQISCEDNEEKGDVKFEDAREYNYSISENVKRCLDFDYENRKEVTDTIKESKDSDTETKVSSSLSLDDTEESDDASSEKQKSRGKYDSENSRVKQSEDMENRKFVESGESLCQKNEMTQGGLDSCECFWEESSLEFELKYMNTELPEYDDLLWCDCNGAEDVQLALPDSCDPIWDEIQIHSP